GTQFKIILALWRYTYGFSRKEAEISDSFIAKAVSSTRQVINKEINNLIDCNMIQVIRASTFTSPRTLKFNKNYNEWSVDVLDACKTITGMQLDACTGTQSHACSSMQLDACTGTQSHAQDKQDIKQDIKQNIYCVFAGKDDEKMEMKRYNPNHEDDYDKTQIGWWKFYRYFEDEELNDLFIKLLDMTEEQSNGFVDGIGEVYAMIEANTVNEKYDLGEVLDMSDEEFRKLDVEKQVAFNNMPVIEDNTVELKNILREGIYKKDIKIINKYLGIDNLVSTVVL
ncbi:hypothetical protein CG709_20235, partial [Lachnotalea glycerini]